MRHRGPDDEGILTNGEFGFGMRRLSIIDIACGHQPICTEDERYSIVSPRQSGHVRVAGRATAAMNCSWATSAISPSIRIGRLLPFARRAGRAAALLPRTPFRSWNRAIQRWQKSLDSAALTDGVSRFFAKTQITSPALRKRLFDPAIHERFEGPCAFEALRDEYFPDPARCISTDDLEQFAYADFTLNLPCAMLTKVDRASMAHSFEVRVPMLSRVLVEWVMGCRPT